MRSHESRFRDGVVQTQAQIDPMYQYSLQYYQALFNLCLKNSEPCEDQARRLEIIIKYSTENCYANICRGLFEKGQDPVFRFIGLQHPAARGQDPREGVGAVCPGPGLRGNQIYFYFLMVRRPYAKKKLEHQDDATFWRSSTNPKPEKHTNPKPEKIPEASWDLLCAAEFNLEDATGEEVVPCPYAGVTLSISKDWDSWLAWLEAPDPYATPLPAPFEESTTRFSKLIAIRALRDEQQLKAVNEYVRGEFGDELADAKAGTMDEIYADLDNATPCIFILSKGSDPTGMLFKLAKQKNYSDRLQLVSLGQGQGPVAESLVEKGTKTGDWVLLQNCMLAKSWMHNLEVMCFEC